MCGRYELHTHPAALALAFGAHFPEDMHPRYNIAPMQDVLVVRNASDGSRECVAMRWGLVPRWAKDPSIGARMINARGESVAVKSAFRWPFEHHRCLIPADGFYEWRTLGGRKQPLHVSMKNGAPFALAGLAERWMSAEGEVVDSCTIVTSAANALLRPVHERMPVIIAPADYERWLDVHAPPPIDLIASFGAETMVMHPVSTRVNVARNDDASLIEAVDAADAGGDATPSPAPPKEGIGATPPRGAPEQEELF